VHNPQEIKLPFNLRVTKKLSLNRRRNNIDVHLTLDVKLKSWINGNSHRWCSGNASAGAYHLRSTSYFHPSDSLICQWI